MKCHILVKGVPVGTWDLENLTDVSVVPAETDDKQRTDEAAEGATPEPVRVKVESKWRDLNAKMKGEEGFALAVSGERLVWLDQHPDAIVTHRGMQPKGIRASERRCHDTCEVPVGMLIIYIKKNGGTTHYTAGRVQEDREKPGQGSLYADDGITHIGTRREGTTFVHILDIDGVRKEFRS